eukprot:gene30381-37586_t
MDLGLLTRGLCSSILQLGRSSSPALHHSFGDTKNYELPHIVAPFWNTVDRLVVTAPGETPPPIGRVFEENLETRTPRRRNPFYTLAVDLENTYSFSLKTSNLDLEQWTVCNLPLMKSMNLHNFWANADLRLCAYFIPGAAVEMVSTGSSDGLESLPKHHPQAVNKYFFACEVQHKSNHPTDWVSSHRHSVHVRTNSKGSGGGGVASNSTIRNNNRMSMSHAAVRNAHNLAAAGATVSETKPRSLTPLTPLSASTADSGVSDELNNSLTQMFGDTLHEEQNNDESSSEEDADTESEPDDQGSDSGGDDNADSSDEEGDYFSADEGDDDGIMKTSSNDSTDTYNNTTNHTNNTLNTPTKLPRQLILSVCAVDESLYPFNLPDIHVFLVSTFSRVYEVLIRGVESRDQWVSLFSSSSSSPSSSQYEPHLDLVSKPKGWHQLGDRVVLNYRTFGSELAAESEDRHSNDLNTNTNNTDNNSRSRTESMEMSGKNRSNSLTSQMGHLFTPNNNTTNSSNISSSTLAIDSPNSMPSSLFKFQAFFRNVCYEAFGDVFSLTELEHCVLRKGMPPINLSALTQALVLPTAQFDFHLQYRDWRLMLAFNCGSVSNISEVPVCCAERLSAQLDDVVRAALVNQFSFKIETSTVTLPLMVQWFLNYVEYENNEPTHITTGGESDSVTNRQLCTLLVKYLFAENKTAMQAILDKKGGNNHINVKYASFDFKCKALYRRRDEEENEEV